MATMASTSIVLSVIVFLLLLSAITSQADGSGGGKPKATGLIVEACKNASDKNENMGVTQEFCLSTLQSDNRSAEAKDLPGLLFVSLDILKGRVIDAGVKVKKMLQNAKKGTVTMYALNICEVEYEKMVSRLNICQAVIKDDKEGGLLSFRRLYHCVYMTDYNIQECGFELPNVRGAEAVLSQNDGLHIELNLNTCLVALYYDVK
ncbi:uncharacterized protein LOC123399727 [Hordeum vulgare subsp. vulgare]|uniref:Pectinesterase inhibitor domain-containing protein n=1 Tax=Hordeum vulgare subsp. vulgare TaxID=112509 RepID=A0A8I6Y598_HORVV|nr:uncharacterized protein LOC123399727 [Hordeum vulgare subsp. vulgare]